MHRLFVDAETAAMLGVGLMAAVRNLADN